MSRLETPMTRWYWTQRGGTLVEEFPVVVRGVDNSPRWLDGLIVLDSPTERLPPRTPLLLTDKRVVIVQAKCTRLGMYLCGQTLFSAELVRRYFHAAQVESIALVSSTDSVLQPRLEAQEGCPVIVAPREVCRSYLSPPPPDENV